MTATVFYASLIVVWIVLYIAAPIWLGLRGWLLASGLVQLIGAMLPGIWQGIFWPDASGSFGLLMMMLALIPIGVIFAGLAVNLYRASCWIVHYMSAKRGL